MSETLEQPTATVSVSHEDRPLPALVVLRAVWKALVDTTPEEVEQLAQSLGTEEFSEEIDEIDDLYARLRELPNQAQTSAADATRANLFKRLRSLQEMEVESMKHEFQCRTVLPDGLAERIITDAKKLVERG